MKIVAEILLVVSLPMAALLLHGQSMVVAGMVLGALGLALVALLSLSHHDERGRLDWTKFLEYSVFTLIVVGLYLYLI